jgi:histidinol-phosphate aminotransferase
LIGESAAASTVIAALLAGREAVAQGAPAMLRLSANENPYGPSESAIKAMTAALPDGWMYAGDSGTLAKLIAEREGVPLDHVLITEGSAEILRLAALIYAPAGAEMIAANPTFEQCPDYAEKLGAIVHAVDLDKDMRHDLGAMEARMTGRTGLVYVCNPNNPTATLLDHKALRSFVDTVASRAMVLVDEAYIDLIDDPAANTMLDRVKAGRNVIIARTFSKIHGMAGLRVGFAIARPDIIRRMNELRMSVPNKMGLVAAIASYQDTAFMTHSRSMIRACMTMTFKALDELGLAYTKSQANFLMFDTGKPMREFMTAMRARNIAVGRPFRPYDTWCRVSMGKLDQMPLFVEALKAHFKRA